MDGDKHHAGPIKLVAEFQVVATTEEESTTSGHVATKDIGAAGATWTYEKFSTLTLMLTTWLGDDTATVASEGAGRVEADIAIQTDIKRPSERTSLLMPSDNVSE